VMIGCIFKLVPFLVNCLRGVVFLWCWATISVWKVLYSTKFISVASVQDNGGKCFISSFV